VPNDFRISESPVALFEGNQVVVDLTGGICDDYRLLKGSLTTDGGAHGEIRAAGVGFVQVLGTFIATRQ
jgi:hypothetical protein